MSHRINKRLVKHKQQGMALVMALIMLLVITILGVSAARMSSNDTQISGNSIYSVLVFQGAESALGRSASSKDWSVIKLAAEDLTSAAVAVPDTYFDAEKVMGNGTLESSGTVQFEGILNGPVINGVANSSDFDYQVFRVTGESKLVATAARDRHTEGRAAQIPKE